MKLTVKHGSKTSEIQFERGENLLKVLHKNGIFITAYCGGKGICKKCIVRFTDNSPKAFELERKALKDKVDQGYRLACLHRLENDAAIEIKEVKPVFVEIEAEPCCDDNKPHIAVDIGTTTIAIAYIENGQIDKTLNILNPQIAFGSDVITRIAYSNEGGFETLHTILKDTIKRSISDFKKPSSMVICANPTMLSFFLGFNPKSIGEYPYTPLFKGSKTSEFEGIRLYVPPVISAFVGSDITAALSILPVDDDFLFVDIGTNCEFILKVGSHYYSSSIPAGPALEGTNIDCGSIAQDGAIYKVSLENGFKVHTINNKKPIGIAGSGLVSAISLLRKYGIIDKIGRLVEAWEAEAPFSLISRIKKEGFMLADDIYLTQNSIRNFQLVKASLNAGIKLLLDKVGLKEPNKVFVGGGFSKSLTKEEIIGSGLLSFDCEFVMLGNSSIKGGVRLFCEKERGRVEELVERIEYVEIANEKQFEELYIESMNFDV